MTVDHFHLLTDLLQWLKKDQLTTREDSEGSKKELKEEDTEILFKREESIEETLHQEPMKRMEAFENITRGDGAVEFNDERPTSDTGPPF